MSGGGGSFFAEVQLGVKNNYHFFIETNAKFFLNVETFSSNF